MGMVHRMTHARFESILARQNPPKFGTFYEPAIKATREEAPGRSRPAFVRSSLLQREISTLSEPERDVLSIILYQPKLFELHEQRMLPYLPAPHPLTGHPRAPSMQLPMMRGTLEITDQLSGLRFHPILPARDNCADLEPGCWIGDFLLFLSDDAGPYCVNISVKSSATAFEVPVINLTVKSNIQRAQQREYIRHKAEEILYADIGIPTIQVAANTIDPNVSANLKQLLLWHEREHPFTIEQQEIILDSFQQGLDKASSALEIIHLLNISFGYSTQQIKTLMYQLIWKRKLRIDLFSIFFVDQSMKPERRDVLEIYANWFHRGAV